MEPVAVVLADFFACFDFDDIAFALAQKAAHEVVVVDFSQKADALRVFAACRCEAVVEGDLAYFVLFQSAQGEHDFLYLPAVELCEKIGLVFHGVGGGAEPYVVGGEVESFGRTTVAKHLVVANAAGVVAGADAVVLMSDFLFERSKLDEAVAHHVGVGRESAAHVLHRVADDAIPVFFLQIYGLERQTVAVCHGLTDFEIFLCGAGEVFVAVHADFDVEKIGAQTSLHEKVCGYGTVYAAGEKEGYVHEKRGLVG